MTEKEYQALHFKLPLTPDSLFLWNILRPAISLDMQVLELQQSFVRMQWEKEYRRYSLP